MTSLLQLLFSLILNLKKSLDKRGGLSASQLKKKYFFFKACYQLLQIHLFYVLLDSKYGFRKYLYQ